MSTLNGTDTQQNYLSCSNGHWGLDDGGPNQKPLDDMPSPLDLMPVNPQEYDAILKVSDGTNGLVLGGLSVSQGFQDSANIANKAVGVNLQGDFGIGSPGLRVITIKGGCYSTTVSGVLHSRGSTTDVKIDDWMDQTYNASSGIDISHLAHADGKPVRVTRNLRATNVMLGSNCKTDWIGSILLTGYWWFKFLVRKAYGIKVGQSGPPWLY